MLYLVATPIGNLGDITLRAIEALKSADLIACEDTRHSLRLLNHLGIRKPLISYHEHNEARRTEELSQRLREGATIALITDAGMPGISDPGRRLLRACIAGGLAYTILPGPSALLTALVGSGFPAESFHYGGFLPVKSGQRERELTAAANRAETSVFFESPHRIIRSLEALAKICPARQVCVARELTKQFEEFRIGIPADVLLHYQAHPPKGEIVLLVSAAERGAKIMNDEL
jgi:16S rRNA (cytidine1402-2'-O)-methyltransferase